MTPPTTPSDQPGHLERLDAQIAGLRGPAAIFIATWLLHTGDHVRRGYDLTSAGVIHGGFVAAILAAITLTLIFTGHRFAPFVATAVFPTVAIGVSATHLLPDWGFFSEPLLFDSAADNFAAVAAIPEIFAAAWLGWLALRVVQANGFQLPTAQTA